MLRLRCEGFMGHVNTACNDFGKNFWFFFFYVKAFDFHTSLNLAKRTF